MSDLPPEIERRMAGPGRRSSDRVVDGVIRHITFLRRIAFSAVTAWAVLGTVACVVLFVALGQSDSTNARATRALTAARGNEAAIAATNRRLIDEVAGLCGVVEDTRSAVNGAHAIIRRIFITAGQFQLRSARAFAHGISAAVRSETRIGERFAAQLIGGALRIDELPALGCGALARDPLGYRAPRSHPFPPRPPARRR